MTYRIPRLGILLVILTLGLAQTGSLAAPGSGITAPPSTLGGAVQDNARTYTYTDPDYGYHVSWDASWVLAQPAGHPTGAEGVDLALTNGISIVYFGGFSAFGMDAVAAVQDLIPAEGQLLGQGGDATSAWMQAEVSGAESGHAAVVVTGVTWAMPPGVLQILVISPAEEAAAQQPAVQSLLANVVLAPPEPASREQSAPALESDEGLTLPGASGDPAATNQTEAGYTIIDLGRGTANAVNDAGQVVGDHYDPPSQANQAVSRDPDGPETNLGALPGHSESSANAINESGQIVGWSATANRDQTHAVLWDGGTISDLGTLPGHAHSTAEAINEFGQIVGWSATANHEQYHAVLWEDGRIVDLGGLGEGLESRAMGINNSGQIVGWAATDGGADHAVLWESDGITDLGALPGFSGSHAYAINDAGQIVGFSWRFRSDGEQEGHATLWEGGETVDLGGPGEGHDSSAYDINEAGQVVGSFGRADMNATGMLEGAFLPAIWEREAMVMLPMPPDYHGAVSAAEGINNAGVAVGHHGSNAVVWIPG